MAMIIGTVIGSGVFKKASIVAKNIPEFGLAISAWCSSAYWCSSALLAGRLPR